MIDVCSQASARDRVQARIVRWVHKVQASTAFLSAFVLLGLFFSAVPLGAQPAKPSDAQTLEELPLEDLLNIQVDTVYAASRLAQEVSRAPASVTIISRDEIRRHGYRTLADILRTVRGLYASYDRNYTYLGVRGFARPGDYNSRILMLVDGHRLNDTTFDQAPVGTESPLDVSLIERVEVIRGPSSSVYGTSAFFAVVNVITRTGASLSGVEAEGEGGTQDVRRGRLTAGGKTASGLEGLASFSAFKAAGDRSQYFPEFDIPGVSDGVARDLDADSWMNFFGSTTVQALTVRGGYGWREKVIPTAPFDTLFNQAGTQTRDERLFLDATVSRSLSERTSLDARLAYDRYNYDGDYEYDTGLVIDGSRGAWTTAEARMVHWFPRHRLSLGFEFRRNHKQDQFAADETGTLLDDHRRSSTAAGYIEDEVQLHARLLVTAGLRWDQYFDTFGGTLNPRLALIVLPTDGIAIKVLHGRAFRAPNPFELYYSQDPLSLELSPERIITNEVVLEQQLGPRAQLTSSVFVSRVKDLITQQSGSDVSLDGLYFDNAGRVRARGLEIELQGELPGRVRARGAWVYQSARDVETDNRISNSPNHLGTFVADVPIGRTGIVAGLNGFLIGERLSVAGEPIDRVFITDMTLSHRRPDGGLSLAITLRNLFDVDYGDPGAEEHRQTVIPQDGRTLSVRATWHF